MNKGLFEYDDYKKFLLDAIRSKPHQGRGEKSRIASALGCHLAYISQVLNGVAQLSLEQADQLNRYLGHSDAEAEYFLLLVLYGRAGTASLQKHYQKKVREAQEHRLNLKNRLEFQKTLTIQDQAIYYSAWYYAAIHLVIAIPEFQTKEALQKRLRISLNQTAKALAFLVQAGLAIEERGRFKPGTTNIHLGADSPMISKHHTNWRMQAIQSLEREGPAELHYSSAVTISRSDMQKIHKMIVEQIEQVRAIVKPSPEEELCCYAVDFFRVGGE